MGNDEIVQMLIRMDEKLNALLKTDMDHETRIRDLEKSDLGRVIPFIVGILTVVSLAVALTK